MLSYSYYWVLLAGAKLEKISGFTYIFVSHPFELTKFSRFHARKKGT